MPEFQLDYGDQYKRFKGLDEFTQGYIEAAFFCGVEGIKDCDLNLDLLSPEAWQRMLSDCEHYQVNSKATMGLALGIARYSRDYDERCMGRDFWYTRNGHGAGFFARGLPDAIENALELAAHSMGECDLYPGDDEKLYTSP